VTDVGSFGDSTDILRFLNERHTGGPALYPADADLRREVDELEELFDTELGPHTRRVAYFHLLPDNRLVKESLLHGVTGFDRIAFTSLMPVIRFLMRRAMNINASSAERSLEKVRRVFEEVSLRVADGRSYLVGDRLSAADLTFAALASPVLLPRNFGARLPSLADLPHPVLRLVDEMRETPAGGFALRLYRDHR
jgi:glutathione S-transferase